jgi:hypothetical protein
MAFDFPNAQTPQLTPLRYSFAVDDVEDQLRNLFLSLFDTYLGADCFDANVLGAAHLGTLDLVRRMVNADGLVFFPGEREEAATRYVYRAWKARNVQGRGLYFLKTYLQALFPGIWNVEQQMQTSVLPYPTALYDRSAHGEDADKFLTSRIHVKLDATGGLSSVADLMPIMEAILPARFIPKLSLVLYAEGRFKIAAVANPSITLRGSGTVQVPEISYGDSTYLVAARGNPSITLRAVSTVSR